MIQIPSFATKEETFKWLRENHDKIIAQKKATIKEADALDLSIFHVNQKGEIVEASKSFTSNKELLTQKKPIRVKCIINTTNVFDSHLDVHIPKLWNKSLKENKLWSLVKEHNFTFDGTITDEVKAYVQTFTWKELGYNMEGETQALVFDAVIYPDDETKMYDRYVKGIVKNHSVGMAYVKVLFCMNSESESDYQYKVNYDKYINEIVNKEDAEARGYFWAVIEAKVIEGSAVKRGSNRFTPTHEVTEIKNSNEDQPASATGKEDADEPVVTTHNKQESQEPASATQAKQEVDLDKVAGYFEKML